MSILSSKSDLKQMKELNKQSNGSSTVQRSPRQKVDTLVIAFYKINKNKTIVLMNDIISVVVDLYVTT